MSNLDVVTGGAGFIGSHLVDFLLAAGRRVLVIDNFVCGQRANLAQHDNNENLRIIDADVADRAAMKAEFSGADRVFHLAAMADIVPSIEEPTKYFDANVNGTLSVLEAARAAGVRRFLYVASSSCYGIPDVYPTPEDTPIQPRYPYALTKYLGEETALHWADVYGMSIVSVRLFNVYGPRARTAGSYGAMFGVFLAQLVAGKPLTIVGTGEQSRDFTFVTDVVDAIALTIEEGAPGRIYNVGTGVDVSVNRIVELLGAADTIHIDKRPGEPDITQADIGRITSELGWQPRVPIEDGIAVMLQNLSQWRDAPVWTRETIAQATASWFKYLG